MALIEAIRPIRIGEKLLEPGKQAELADDEAKALVELGDARIVKPKGKK